MWIVRLVLISLLMVACNRLRPLSPQRAPDLNIGDNPDVPSGDDAQPTIKTITFEVRTIPPSDQVDLYGTKVRPVLLTSCLASGCHTTPQTIDLRSFPFNAEGSYIMDRITADLGENPDILAAQKMIVQELISSIESFYMPPPPIEAPSENQVADIQSWLTADLPILTTNFSGILQIQGFAAEEQMCTLSWPIAQSIERFKTNTIDCADIDRINYIIKDDANITKAEGSMPIDSATTQFFSILLHY